MFDEKIMRTNPASPVPITKEENSFCITEGNGITLTEAVGQNNLDLFGSDIVLIYKEGNNKPKRTLISNFTEQSPAGFAQNLSVVAFNLHLKELPIVITFEKLAGNESFNIFFDQR